jgi:hypothetical protein
MTSGWQTQVFGQPAAAVPGNRASSNPIATYQGGGPSGLVAGAAGCVVGKFAWVYPPTNVNEEYTRALNTSQAPGGFPTVVPAGLVPNDQQAQNSTFLSNAGMTILSGYQMYLVTQGDWWVVNAGATVPIPNYSKAFASVIDGSVFFANPGSTFGGATASSYTIAANTTVAAISMTGSVADDILTVTAVSTGTLYPGVILTGPAGIATGTTIISQLTPLLAGEATGGIGRYLLSIGGQTVASGTVVGTYGILTLTTVATGNFAVGDILSGTGVTANTQITQFLTGTGGTGSTAVVNYTQTASSGTLTASTAVETKWVATSSGPLNAIVKISSWQP